MEDPQMIAVVFSGIVSGVVGLLTFFVTFWKSRRELVRERDKINEEVTAELIQQRIDPYTDLMRKLEVMSNTRMSKLETEERACTAKDFAQVFHDAIYGNVGLLASHETREVIVCTRRRCLAYSEGKIEYREMLLAIWAVHQTLRADLNLRQPKLANAIDRLRQKNVAADKGSIEGLIDSIVHIEWEEINQ